MRTSVGKLTDPAKTPSIGAARILTDWDNWIMENFGYLEKHIKRVDAGKRKEGGQLSHSLSAKSGSTSNRGTSDDDDTTDADVILDTLDDGRDLDTSRSKGGPFKGSIRSKGSPPPSKKTSRRHQEPLHHQQQPQQVSDASTHAASGGGGGFTTQAVTQVGILLQL